MRKLRGESWLELMMIRARTKKAAKSEKEAIGVLTFEVSSLLSKVIHLWHSLGDAQISRLREEILHLQGVRKLVSNDDDFLIGLALTETMSSVDSLASSVARIGKRCNDPFLHRFEHIFSDLIKNGSDLYGLEFPVRKMESKVKKMERFVAAGANLYQELEVLAELEQGLRRMQANPEMRRQGSSLLDFKQKVAWQRQAVSCLREVSVWNRSYEYITRLLVRSLFTIVGRIGFVFGFHQMDAGVNSKMMSQFSRSYSVSGVLHSAVHPSDGGGINRFSSMLGTKSGPIVLKNGATFSQRRGSLSLPFLKHRSRGTKWQVSGIPFRGCMVGGNSSPVLESCIQIDGGVHTLNSITTSPEGAMESADPQPPTNIFNTNLSLIVFDSRRKFLTAPPSTLGAAALALHYANVIIVIEKLSASPHLIGNDARDDLYGMLPTSIRGALRMRLKSYAKNLALSVYDPELAADWSDAIARILEWLAPLAHNMIKWQSDRNFEQQHLMSSTNVLLLQTLYYANQAKTEAAVTELLVGLNYLWRFGRELNAKAIIECASNRNLDDCSETSMINTVGNTL